MIRMLLLAAGMVLAIGGSAIAQGLETEPLAEGKPCAAADIVGLWESRVVTANATTAAWSKFIALDYMRFSPDGQMMYYGADKPETNVRAIQDNLDRLDAVDRTTYGTEILSPGLLIINRDGRPFQGFTCTMVEARRGEPTMILSQLKGMAPVRRLQRRLD
jgi:hypothetical protein